MAILRQRFCSYSINGFVMPSNLVPNVKFSPYIRVYKYVILFKLIFPCLCEKHNGILDDLNVSTTPVLKLHLWQKHLFKRF